MLFQGEMGSEGLRGLAGESGKKGAKVRFIWNLSDFNLSLEVIILIFLLPLNREITVFQDPEDHLGHPENLEEMWAKI